MDDLERFMADQLTRIRSALKPKEMEKSERRLLNAINPTNAIISRGSRHHACGDDETRDDR